MKKSKLVVFDLNKTLIKENSWLELNLDMGVTQAEDDELIRKSNAGEITDSEAQAWLCSIYKQRGNPTRQSILRVLSSYTYLPGAKEVVKSLQEKGFKIALLSGSMNVLVDEIAEELGIELRASNNTFTFDTEGNLDEILTSENDTEFKLHQVKEWSSRLNISPQDIVCVGDGANDKLLFENFGISITFEDSELASIATHQITNLREIVDLL